MAYSSCYPSLSIICSIAVSSYRKIGPFFFFFGWAIQEEGEGATNKKKEKNTKEGGFQECTHKNCRKWGQPFWTKMGSLIALPLDLWSFPKKERREEKLYFSCGTVLPTNRSFGKRLPLFCHVPILNISSAVAETKHKIIFIIKKSIKYFKLKFKSS
jgi:hypothetical protein